jgi:hypothetical protein
VTDPPEAPKRSLFIRSIYAASDVELFLVTAIATILIVRSVLAATGWPQLGGGKIHFAHLLWGGIGMLIAMVLFMVMEGRLWKRSATFVAGVGFGLFIDELGKFITSDNDYFFKPAAAFIYLTFVVVFLVVHVVVRRAVLSPQASLVNALDLAKEAAIHDLDESEHAQILALLSQCDQDDPMVRDMTRMITGISSPTGPARDLYFRTKGGLRRFYGSLVTKRWFKTILIAYLALVALVGIGYAIGVVIVTSSDSGSVTLGFWEWGQVLSAIASAALIVIGFVRWRRSRLAAYHWFERALLVTIFIEEFFAFYQNQTTQVFGLVIVLLTYAAVRGMIAEEEAGQRSRLAGDEALPA